MLIQMLLKTQRDSVGTSVAKGRCGTHSMEQVAWLMQGDGPASSRDLQQVSLEVLSNLCDSAVLCWR